MQLGIFAKTFSGTEPDDVLASVVRTGYKAAHYNWACSGIASMPDHIPRGIAEQVASAAQAHSVSIVGLSATWNMAHPDPAIRQKGLLCLDVMGAKARIIGTKFVTLCTGTRDVADQWRHHPDNSSADAWRDMIASLRRAVELADRHDLYLGIEPELSNIVCNIDVAERLFVELPSPRLKLVLDPANLFEIASTSQVSRLVEHAVEKLGPCIAMAHAKDRDASGQFVAAGQGIVDFDHFIKTLKAGGFTGPIVTHGLTAEEAPAVHDFLHTNLAKHGCLT